MDRHPYIDEQNQCLLNPNYNVPKRDFSKRITRSLGVMQCLIGIPCLVLALALSSQSFEVNCSNCHTTACRCNCTHSGGIRKDDPLGLFSLNHSGMTRFGIFGAVVGCLFIFNGFIGLISSFKSASHCLNMANGMLAMSNVLLSLGGIIICTYAIYFDGKYYNATIALHIAGLQAGCYVESIASLCVVHNCWKQTDFKLCSCACACAGFVLRLSYGDEGGEENTHSNQSRNDSDIDGSHYQQEIEESEQNSLHKKEINIAPGRSVIDDGYVAIRNNGQGARQRCLPSEENTRGSAVGQSPIDSDTYIMPENLRDKTEDTAGQSPMYSNLCQKSQQRGDRTGSDADQNHTYSNTDLKSKLTPTPKKPDRHFYEDMNIDGHGGTGR